MNSEHLPSAVGMAGILGTITLADLNTVVALLVGCTTLVYLVIKIYNELKNKN